MLWCNDSTTVNWITKIVFHVVGLEDKAHVLQEGKNELYNAVLGLVDISRGTNSFYKLQVLESDKGNK